MDTGFTDIARIDPYIFVVTDRRTVPNLFCAFVLGLSIRRIPIPIEVTERLLSEQVDWVSRTVARHFDINAGILAPFGPITGYSYVRTAVDAIAFDVGGRVVNYFSKPPYETDGWPPVRAADNCLGSRPARRARGILREVE
jgi:hypothetical protein